jgi:zinc transport system substrate-binding protein
VESTRVVGVSLSPLASLTEAVAGDSWDVVALLPPGRSPHDFEPTPAGLRALDGTPLVVMVGTSADSWMERAVRAVGDPDLRIASLSQVAAPDADPHLWLDLDVVERFLPLLADRFAELDPGGARGYRDRAGAVRDSLAAFDAATSVRLAPLRTAPFVLLHPALEVFVTRYGLDLVAVLQTQPEGEAHPRKLGEVARELRARGGRVIFAEPQLSEKLATSIALETGGDVHFLDPLGGPGVPGRETYFDLLRWNAQQLVEALSDGS